MFDLNFAEIDISDSDLVNFRYSGLGELGGGGIKIAVFTIHVLRIGLVFSNSIVFKLRSKLKCLMSTCTEKVKIGKGVHCTLYTVHV